MSSKLGPALSSSSLHEDTILTAIVKTGYIIISFRMFESRRLKSSKTMCVTR